MPATAKVRVTRSNAQTPAVMTLSRATQDYHDEAGEHDYKAPLGPACCMYNTCVEETIPYLGKATEGGPSRMLAIWPESADVDLRPRGPGIEPGEVADGIANEEKGVRVVQLIRSGDRRLASTAGPCGSCGALWVESGGGAPGAAGDPKGPTSKKFVKVGGIGIGPDGFDIVATTDVDGDGQAEAIVYEVWRNDYGVHVLGMDWSKPAYRFSCGNI